MAKLQMSLRKRSAAFLFTVLFPHTSARTPSHGCSQLLPVHATEAHVGNGERLVHRHIVVADFEEVKREYWVQVPASRDMLAPLLFAFHGQSGDGESFAESHNFSALGAQSNLMVVFPQGMNDSTPGEDQGTGWNVGSAGNNATCVPEGVGQSYGCYQSCQKLKKCGRCNWSTCYNDVLFIKAILEELSAKYCIDLDRVYAQGESNGAEMVHHLVRELPRTFAAVATWFGTPLLGFLLGGKLQLLEAQSEISQTAFLALHGRNDTTIPPAGGVSDGGWIFEPLEQSSAVWAALHQCDKRQASIQTRWDGGPLNFKCVEHQRCRSGRRIVQCMYDGAHGDWPSGTDGDQITLWFFLQFSRHKSPTSIEEVVPLEFV